MTEDKIIVIDSDLRTMTIPSGIKHLGVESDSDVLKLQFRMPRYYGDFDLSIFQIQIKMRNANGEPDVAYGTDIIVRSESISFAWLVGRFVLRHPGEATFSVCLKKLSSNGITTTVDQEFNTIPVTLPVRDGIDADAQIVQKYPDVLEAWKNELYGRFDGQVDATLLEVGYAAEAKTTGDRIRNLRTILENKIKVEQVRVAQLIALASGGIEPTDSELLNIRIGANGKEYESAGESVRGQISDLTESVANSIRTETLQQAINDSLVVGARWVYVQDGEMYDGVESTNVRGISDIFTVMKDIQITINPIYYASVIWVTNDNICIQETGWTKGPVTVGAGSRFALNFRRQDETAMSTSEIYDIFTVEILDPPVQSLETRMDTAEHDISLLDSHLSSSRLTARLNKIVIPAQVWSGVTVGSPIVTGQASARAILPICKLASPIDISAASGFFVSVIILDDDLNCVSETGWTASTTRVPAETYFALNITNTSHSALSEEDAHRSLVAALATNDTAVQSAVLQCTDIEYGRYEGASYVFVRIPRMTNAGNPIRPKLALTSVDGSLNGSKRSAMTFASTSGASVTMNAGLFDVTNMVPVGQTIIDGVSVTNTPMADDNGTPISDAECYPLCIDADGMLSAPYDRSVDTATMIADGITQAVTGWGKIVENFVACADTVENEIVHDGKYIRQVLGQFQNGDYFICTVDMSRGSVENEAGVTYEALANLLISKGVKFAYSLDGGGSAETVIGVRQINPIYEGTAGRAVPTVIYFEEVQG